MGREGPGGADAPSRPPAAPGGFGARGAHGSHTVKRWALPACFGAVFRCKPSTTAYGRASALSEHSTNVTAPSKPPVTAASLPFPFPSHPSHRQHRHVPNGRSPRCPIPEPNDPGPLEVPPRHNAPPAPPHGGALRRPLPAPARWRPSTPSPLP